MTRKIRVAYRDGEGREVLRFSLAAQTAARQNRPVRLEELG